MPAVNALEAGKIAALVGLGLLGYITTAIGYSQSLVGVRPVLPCFIVVVGAAWVDELADSVVSLAYCWAVL